MLMDSSGFLAQKAEPVGNVTVKSGANAGNQVPKGDFAGGRDADDDPADP
jgi:hypothetical protein